MGEEIGEAGQREKLNGNSITTKTWVDHTVGSEVGRALQTCLTLRQENQVFMSSLPPVDKYAINYPLNPQEWGVTLGEVALFSRGQCPERDAAVSCQQSNCQKLEK